MASPPKFVVGGEGGVLGFQNFKQNLTPAQFYWRMVKAAYTKRLGGEEHLDSYHWERPMSELEALDRQEGAQPNQWSRSCPRW